MSETFVAFPGAELPEEYFECRYATLREPLGFPPGSEHLPDDGAAIHAWVVDDGKIVSVGRSHLIPSDCDGSQADHSGPDAVTCPAFDGLNDSTRPAIQIRQMGTINAYRRNGHARCIIDALESASRSEFAAKYGFLQAREHAIPFYLNSGWLIIGDRFDIPGIGIHATMTKQLT